MPSVKVKIYGGSLTRDHGTLRMEEQMRIEEGLRTEEAVPVVTQRPSVVAGMLLAIRLVRRNAGAGPDLFWGMAP